MRENKRRIAIILFIAIISVNSFGAIVSDNDGSTFVTKAEFDTLKKSFAKQINDYNSSIDGKIDGAIASYLAGITIQKSEIVQTGLTLDGYNDSVVFVGPNYTSFNHTKEPWVRDILYAFAAKTYAATYIAVDETYNYVSWLAYKDVGDSGKKNFLIYRDADGFCRGKIQNYTATYMRNLVAYSNNYAQFGGAFISCDATLNKPEANVVDPSTDVLVAQSIGFSNRNLSSAPYNKIVQKVLFYGDSYNKPAKNPDGTYTPPAQATSTMLNGSKWDLTRNASMRFADNVADCSWNYLTRTGAFAFGGANYPYTAHFPKGSPDQWMCVDHDFQSYENIATASSVLESYTTSKKLDLVSGIMAEPWDKYWKATRTDGEANRFATYSAHGYGLKVNYTKYNIEDIFYPSSESVWKIKNSMGKGFLLYYDSVSSGNLSFDIKVSSYNGTLWFKKSTYDASDLTSDTNLISFSYSVGGSTPVETKKLTLQKDKTYHITINYNRNDKLYMFPIPSDTQYINIAQVGDAIFIKE